MASKINATIRVDLVKSAKQNLITLINKANGTKFNVDELLIGTPTAPDTTYPEYTEVQVSGNEDQGYTDSVTVAYNRIDLGDIVLITSEYLPVATDATPAEVQQAVEAFLGTLAGEVKISDTFTADQTSVDVAPIADSLVYFNQIKLQLGQGIENLITDVYVDGFAYSAGTTDGGLKLSSIINPTMDGFVQVARIENLVNDQAAGFSGKLDLAAVLTPDQQGFTHVIKVPNVIGTLAKGFATDLDLSLIIKPDLQGFNQYPDLNTRLATPPNGFGYGIALSDVVETDAQGFSFLRNFSLHTENPVNGFGYEISLSDIITPDLDGFTHLVEISNVFQATDGQFSFSIALDDDITVDDMEGFNY